MKRDRDLPPGPETLLWLNDQTQMDTQDIMQLLDEGLDCIRAALCAELERRGIVIPAGRVTKN